MAQIRSHREQISQLLESREGLVAKKRTLVNDRMAAKIRNELISHGEPPDRGALVRAASDVDVLESELYKKYDEVIVWWNLANQVVTGHSSLIRPGQTYDEWIQSEAIAFGDSAGDFGEAVMRHLFNEAHDSLYPTATSASASPVVEASPADDDLRLVESKLMENLLDMRLANGEWSALSSRASSLVTPKSGWVLIGILVYIAASSAILPLSLMPAADQERWMRPVTVGLFAVGLTALLFYVVWEFASVRLH